MRVSWHGLPSRATIPSAVETQREKHNEPSPKLVGRESFREPTTRSPRAQPLDEPTGLVGIACRGV